MAHKSDFPLDVTKNEVKVIVSRLQGAGAANMTPVNSGTTAQPITDNEIVSATRTGTGVFDLVFRRKYPQQYAAQAPAIVGTTVGLMAVFTAWDPAAGTATIAFSIGSVATDPAATDRAHLTFLARNSGRN